MEKMQKRMDSIESKISEQHKYNSDKLPEQMSTMKQRDINSHKL